MRFWDELRRRVAVLLRRERVSGDLAEEMQFHLEMEAEEHRRNGLTPDAARVAARRRFGNPALLAEESLAVWGWNALEDFVRDVAHALRAMRRAPVVSAAAMAALALGIGGNVAIFSVIHALLFRSLPVANPGELRFVVQRTRQGEDPLYSYSTIRAFRDGAHSVSGVLGFASPGAKSIDLPSGDSEKVHLEYVTGRYFDVLGIRPVIGRMLVDADDRAQPGAAVISHGLWVRRFSASPSAIGSTLRWGMRTHTVVGVAPKEFTGLTAERSVDVWFSAAHVGLSCIDTPSCPAFRMVVRVPSTAGDRTAAAELNALYRETLDARTERLPPAEAAEFRNRSVELIRAGAGSSVLGRQWRQPLLALMGLVAVALLLACGNISNMLLARAAARSREMAVRAAIGAGRARLIRQMLTESFVLAICGGGLGLLLAGFGAKALVTRYSDPALRVSLNVAPDGAVLAFTALISVLTGALFGLAPALQASAGDVNAVLKGGVSARRITRWNGRAMLLALQAALSLVLLVGAWLFAMTLIRLKTVAPGFDRERILTVTVAPAARYGPEFAAATLRLVEALRHAPGVSAASFAGPPPPYQGPLYRAQIPWYQPRSADDMDLSRLEVGSAFFETTGTPILQGRPIEARDRGRKVAVINETFAKRYFGGEGALGRIVEIAGAAGDVAAHRESLEIVGVAADMRMFHPREAPKPTVFVAGSGAGTPMVRVAGDTRALRAVLPHFVRRAEPGVRFVDTELVAEAVDRLLIRERMLAHLSGCFGALALLLACLGVYGVTAYAVTQRTAEIGVRMALGARRLDVLRMLLRQTLAPVVAGISVGVTAILAGGGILKSLLFELKPADPAALAPAGLLLAAVAALAAWLPARRATRIDAIRALRHD